MQTQPQNLCVSDCVSNCVSNCVRVSNCFYRMYLLFSTWVSGCARKTSFAWALGASEQLLTSNFNPCTSLETVQSLIFFGWIPSCKLVMFCMKYCWPLVTFCLHAVSVCITLFVHDMLWWSYCIAIFDSNNDHNSVVTNHKTSGLLQRYGDVLIVNFNFLCQYWLSLSVWAFFR